LNTFTQDTVFSNNQPIFADVILPLPLPQLFTYAVPLGIQPIIGSRVVVPFGQRKVLTGIIHHLHTNKPTQYEAKTILEILDNHAIINNVQLRLMEWMASYYMCTLGEVLQAMLPTAFKLSSQTRMQLHPQWTEFVKEQPIDEREEKILEVLKQNESVEIDKTEDILGIKAYQKYIKSLLSKRLIIVFEALKEKYQPKIIKKARLTSNLTVENNLKQLFETLEGKTAKAKQLELLMKYIQLVPVMKDKNLNLEGIAKIKLLAEESNSAYNTLVKNGIFTEFEEVISRFDTSEIKTQGVFPLSEEQQKASSDIVEKLLEKEVVLLHGVTGSGKTEIYNDIIQKTIDQGETVLYLLPEIALTIQIVARLKKIFGNDLGVYHSRFSDNERVEIWNGVLENKFKIVVGTRSSLFLPFSHLGLIVVDEEHETSYKQHDPAPRFNARDTAIVLAKFHHAKVVLGSATPSVESYFNANNDKYGLVHLHSRYGNATLPAMEVVEITRGQVKEAIHFSEETRNAIQSALNKNEQIIVFQNRRGYAPYLQCRDCEWVPTCVRCSVSLTYHKYANELRCHYCGYKEKNPTECKSCKSPHVQTLGLGTEKIEDELQIFFPDARIQRMDLETTRTKNAYENIIHDFGKQKIDILVGTQMLTKGLDFDHVTLVVVADIDQLLHFPDFRAKERAYQLITQVAGRAGRREKLGKVILQTRSKQKNEVFLELVMNYKFDEMIVAELHDRHRFKYPPYVRLIKITVKHKDRQKAEQGAKYIATELKNFSNEIAVLGPATPGISRINDQYLQEIVIKFPKEYAYISKTKGYLQQIMNHLYIQSYYKGLRIIPDVDFY
jgi:primosomal protein N' (replication factor Y) (superfamily II helicase)